MNNEKPKSYDIDAVFTWVDGNDIAHQQKMESYLKDDSSWSNENFKTRFDQVDEIELAVKSIIKFAPYIRKIFIVTDGQTPSFLSDYNATKKNKFPVIKIIDHKVIFSKYESYLPTFNCLPIETLLYEIPNLSEYFIYFNDDFFLVNETKPADFFIHRHPVIRGKWTSFDEKIFYKVIHQRMVKFLGKTTKDKKYGYKKGQQTAAKMLGFEKYFKMDHTPAPMRISTLKKYFNKHPSMELQNIRHKFRNPEQYVLQSLANHIEIKNKSCNFKYDYQLVYFGSYKKPLIWYKFILYINIFRSNKLFLNMQSLDLCPEHKLNFIKRWMDKRFTY